jgi:hypothetical protein
MISTPSRLQRIWSDHGFAILAAGFGVIGFLVGGIGVAVAQGTKSPFVLPQMLLITLGVMYAYGRLRSGAIDMGAFLSAASLVATATLFAYAAGYVAEAVTNPLITTISAFSAPLVPGLLIYHGDRIMLTIEQALFGTEVSE